eukprot:NODE_790_length_1643_cov_75.937995_g780_i0.p1 GENE.NODE_790_length_1643_cov_75.937995_g780_i0~~NODE_790_length_1643_cov_75.937995_g780_i0.p1  ORF type:complete len:485 (-),score=55.24 NODE_790_length_1643_cov_75.937995_g780_i0:189-1568(-)
MGEEVSALVKRVQQLEQWRDEHTRSDSTSAQLERPLPQRPVPESVVHHAVEPAHDSILATSACAELPTTPSRKLQTTKEWKTHFETLYWAGGRPSTYQRVQDFDRQYQCPVNPETGMPCSMTVTNRVAHNVKDATGRYDNYDAVLYRAWFAPAGAWLYPKVRNPHQQYVLMFDEAPYITNNLKAIMSHPVIDNFNVSMGYTRSSHINMAFGPSWDRLFDVPPLPARERTKAAPVAWVAHNCEAPNHRHRLVEALMKHVKVDSFGDCLHTAEWPDFMQYERKARRREHITAYESGVPRLIGPTMEKFIGRYKFYLSLENQNCDDYLSEKFWRAMYAGTLPIVAGPPNLKDFLPAPNAFINADDYDSVEKLAEYITYLDGNDTAYDEIMSWRLDPCKVLPGFKDIAAKTRISSKHWRGYARPMEELMCDLCWFLQVNSTVPHHIEPITSTCNMRDYRTKWT